MLGSVLSEPSGGVARVIQRPGISGRKGYRSEGPLPLPLSYVLTLRASPPAPSLPQMLVCPAATHRREGWDRVYDVTMVEKSKGLRIRSAGSPSALPLTCCVTLDQSLQLSGLQLPHEWGYEKRRSLSSLPSWV